MAIYSASPCTRRSHGLLSPTFSAGPPRSRCLRPCSPVPATVVALVLPGEIKAQRFLVERFLLFVDLDELADLLIENLVLAFTGGETQEITFWINDDESRPGIDGVSAPDLHVSVVHHGMSDL